MIVKIVPATRVHVWAIMGRLRGSDNAGFELAGDDTAAIIMIDELERSTVAYAAVADGQVAAIWGARTETIFADDAYIWMVGSTLIEQYPLTFLRHSRRVVAHLRTMYKRLYGLVLCDYAESVAWLRWLGFDVSEPQDGLRLFRSV